MSAIAERSNLAGPALSGSAVVLALLCVAGGCLLFTQHLAGILLVVVGCWVGTGHPAHWRQLLQDRLENVVFPTCMLATWALVQVLGWPEAIFQLAAVVSWVALSAGLILRWADQAEAAAGLAAAQSREPMPDPLLEGWQVALALLAYTAACVIIAFAHWGVPLLAVGVWIESPELRTQPVDSSHWPWSLVVVGVLVCFGLIFYLPHGVSFPLMAVGLWVTSIYRLTRRWRRQVQRDASRARRAEIS